MKFGDIIVSFFYVSGGGTMLYVAFLSWRTDRERRKWAAQAQARDLEIHQLHLEMLEKARKTIIDKLKSLEG